ncbi:MAG: glutamate 5-kinase [Cellulomonadaceae bacterium]|jgi:glutamate 5-kinase|nr:glutamate 5-kinase [Cellulomonadaceae bacterium]
MSASVSDGLASQLHEHATSPVAGAHRIVVKVGSSSLTGADGFLDELALQNLVTALAKKAKTSQMVLVTSGAVAAGLRPLGYEKRPADIASVQAAASVGQVNLVAAYANAFARHGLLIGQVLLTADDTVRRRRYDNAQRALTCLLEQGVVPIINENDAVTTKELKFGDNDRLAALVALLVRADALVLLTDVAGLFDRNPSDPWARRIPYVENLADIADVQVTAPGSSVGTGGMITKLDAARIATASGIPVLLASASAAAAALGGEDIGTVFAPVGRRASGRMHWLAHAAKVRGKLILDDGAAAAIRAGSASLLAVGVLDYEGEFDAGDPVALVDGTGKQIARGLVAFDSVDLARLLGRNTRWLRVAYGPQYERPIIHRDDLVITPA